MSRRDVAKVPLMTVSVPNVPLAAWADVAKVPLAARLGVG